MPNFRSSLLRNCTFRRAMSTRTYQNAIQHLNSLQSNAATLEAVRASGGRLSEFAIPEMIEYLERIGYTPEDLNALNVIHITGTKGKGSTSAFTNSILRKTVPEWRIGLYTSPHLVAVRERIRVNGTPLSEESFTKYFFEVWDRLEVNTTRQFPSTTVFPGYFRFVTLLAFHAFLDQKVDATILEVGVGGTYDSTNIVPRPVVTGVTSLGIDHIAVLGPTLKDIAHQKGGIYKKGVPALTVNQPSEGLEVLRQRAAELEASSFNVISLTPGLSSINLGLSGTHQVSNANLAIHLARSFLKTKSIPISEKDGIPDAFKKGLEEARWPGRCQFVHDPAHEKTSWYLDGAHTVESLECCMQWFASPGVGLAEDKQRPKRVLIFNCTNGRSAMSMLSALLSKVNAQVQLNSISDKEEPGTFFDHVIFCTNVTYANGGFKGDLTAVAIPEDDLAVLKTQQALASAWRELIPNFSSKQIHVLPSIEHAVKVVRDLDDGSVQQAVLVTGSLHLVGGVIEVAGLSEVAL